MQERERKREGAASTPGWGPSPQQAMGGQSTVLIRRAASLHSPGPRSRAAQGLEGRTGPPHTHYF